MLNKLICCTYIVILVLLATPHAVFAGTTPPVSTFTISPAIPNGENDWYVSYPNISISAIDDSSGVAAINHKINDEPWQRTTFTEGLNVVQNPSFEQGYIYNWDFDGPLLSVGFKSSLWHRTGNYGASIISLSPFYDNYWRNDGYFTPLPLQTYNYSFYIRSVTSWLDNGYFEIYSSSPTSGDTMLASDYNIDLKWNYKKVSGTFTTTADLDALLYIKIGTEQMGHLNIEDVYISTAGEEPSVSFVLDQEGVNTIQYYSEDAAGNIENTRSAEIKIDTNNPNFSGFETFDAESLEKFASRISVTDSVSGLVDSPALFNYAVDGFTDGFYDDYQNCDGNFNEDLYINLSTNYSTGANSGQVSTTVIDYCDTNWVNCKRLNFFVKDIAGNIGSHSICVNGPYITSNYGNAFARNSFYQMGLGSEHNVWGVALSGGEIVDISSFINTTNAFYMEPPYLNTAYPYYIDRLGDIIIPTTDIDTSSGVYSIDSDYTISNELSYPNGVNQIIFINGDLRIESNVISTDLSGIYYIVNGDIIIDTSTTQVDINLLSTNQIFTSSDNSLAERITINGTLIGQNLVFSRNTDRTLGASEIINFPIHTLFDKNDLYISNMYWQEILD